MSVRKRELSERHRLMLRSGRFYLDRQGRMHRVCRCAWCTGTRRRWLEDQHIEWEMSQDGGREPFDVFDKSVEVDLGLYPYDD